MTKKKPRNITPYTTNVASIGFGGYTEPLESVLDKFFDSEAGSNTSERILQAIAAYDMAVKTNPTRQRAKKQRDDWRELIESMKELNQRLHPFYIPPPMLDTARSAYTKHAGGKPTLNEEIRDLLLRLLHLQKIFEATIIPTPSW